MTDSTLTRGSKTLLFIVLVTGVAIRVYSIDYDLPFLYDQDEPIFVTRALSILKNRDLNPHWFGAPATTIIYSLALIYSGIYLGGRLLGGFQNAEAFRDFYYSDPTIFYVSGRMLSLVFGIASIWLVYRIGRKLSDHRTGIAAAAIVALSPLHIWLSQQVRMDVPMSFLLLAAFWFSLEILEKGHWRSYLAAGFLVGLATVTKYPAAVFTLTIALAHILRTPSWKILEHRKLLGSAGACITGAFVGSPYLFLDFRAVLKDVIAEARPEHLGASGEGILANLWWYFSGPLPDNLSVVGVLLAGFGIVLCLRSFRKDFWTLTSAPVIFLVFIAALNLRWARWILPAIPFFSLLLAIAITRLFSLLRAHRGSAWANLVAAICLLLVLVPLLVGAHRHLNEVAAPHTSTLARQWAIQHVPSGSRVLVEVYGPQLPVGGFTVYVVNEAGELIKSEEIGSGNYQPGWDFGRIKDLSELSESQIQYVVLAGFYERYVTEADGYPMELEKYKTLMNMGRLVYEIESSPGIRKGPRVQVYKLEKETLLTLSVLDSYNLSGSISTRQIHSM